MKGWHTRRRNSKQVSEEPVVWEVKVGVFLSMEIAQGVRPMKRTGKDYERVSEHAIV